MSFWRQVYSTWVNGFLAEMAQHPSMRDVESQGRVVWAAKRFTAKRYLSYSGDPLENKNSSLLCERSDLEQAGPNFKESRWTKATCEEKLATGR
jgi:hypothetical protein